MNYVDGFLQIQKTSTMFYEPHGWPSRAYTSAKVIRGVLRMDAGLPSIISEFETAEQEANYTAWLRAKVASSLADKRPSIPHDAVMAEMDEIIAEAKTSAQRKC